MANGNALHYSHPFKPSITVEFLGVEEAMRGLLVSAAAAASAALLALVAITAIRDSPISRLQEGGWVEQPGRMQVI